MAHLGFPMEMELLGVENVIGIRWPTVYFQVCFFFSNLRAPVVNTSSFLKINSVDMWSVHRIQGYGYCHLPSNPGHTKQTVKCWKPVGKIRSQMKDYFIGGSGGLRDIKMSGVPMDIQVIFTF